MSYPANHVHILRLEGRSIRGSSRQLLPISGKNDRNSRSVECHLGLPRKNFRQAHTRSSRRTSLLQSSGFGGPLSILPAPVDVMNEHLFSQATLSLSIPFKLLTPRFFEEAIGSSRHTSLLQASVFGVSDLAPIKAVKARFWPWLEPLSVRKFLTPFKLLTPRSFAEVIGSDRGQHS